MGIVMIAQAKFHKSLSQARERMLFQVVRVKMETWWKSLLECLKLPSELGDEKWRRALTDVGSTNVSSVPLSTSDTG